MTRPAAVCDVACRISSHAVEIRAAPSIEARRSEPAPPRRAPRSCWHTRTRTPQPPSIASTVSRASGLPRRTRSHERRSSSCDPCRLCPRPEGTSPGALVLDTERQGGDDVGILAVCTSDKHLALFFVNEMDAPAAVSLQVDGAAPERLTVRRTDTRAVASPAGTMQLDAGAGYVELPARSITTLSSS